MTMHGKNEAEALQAVRDAIRASLKSDSGKPLRVSDVERITKVKSDGPVITVTILHEPIGDGTRQPPDPFSEYSSANLKRAMKLGDQVQKALWWAESAGWESYNAAQSYVWIRVRVVS